MNARQKLNRLNILGAIGAGALVGALGQSWTLAIAVAAIGIAVDLWRGAIRPNRRTPQ